MTNRLELNWKLDGFVDEQRYYCSETPIDINNLPAPKAILSNTDKSYIDTAIELDKTYYVCVGSVKNSIEKLSVIKKIETSVLNTILLMHFNDDFINQVDNEQAAVDGFVQFVNGLFGHAAEFGLSSPNTNQLRFLNKNGRFNLTGMFTAEGYIKHTTTIGAYRNVFSCGSSFNTGGLALSVNNGRLTIDSMYVVNILNSNKVLTRDEAIRFAITRDEDNILRLFIDGVLDSQVVTDNLFSFSETGFIYIGNHPNGSGGVGVIDEFRLVEGQCLYKQDYALRDSEFTL